MTINEDEEEDFYNDEDNRDESNKSPHSGPSLDEPAIPDEPSLEFKSLEGNKMVSFRSSAPGADSRRVPRRRVKRAGILSNNPHHHSATRLAYGEDGTMTPTGLPVDMQERAQEVMQRSIDLNNASSSIADTASNNSTIRASILSTLSSDYLSNGEISVQQTDLHHALAQPELSLTELRQILDQDPSAASFPDSDGKLPLHVVAENEELHHFLGLDLDSFILNELIQRNRRALVSRSTAGEFPFVQAIQDWVENINEVPDAPPPLGSMSPMSASPKSPSRKRSGLIKEQGAGSASSFASSILSIDFNFDSSNRDDEDSASSAAILKRQQTMAEKLIPWNVFIDDLAFWSIDMLSKLIEREHLKVMWVRKLVDVVAAIPNFIKTILLIDEDTSRKRILETRLLQEVLLHPDSIGNWLVYMITNDDEIAQDRAVSYLQIMTKVDAQVSSDSRRTFSSRTSNAFTTSNNNFTERQNKVYTKAAALPGIIPAFMQFNSSNFTKCSTTSIVQFILDQKLFQPTTVAVILLDIFFLTIAVVLYTLCSNKVFKLVSEIKYSPQVSYMYNQTLLDLCSIGGANVSDSLDATCQYLQQQNESYSLGAVGIFHGGFYECDAACQVCQGHADFFNQDGSLDEVLVLAEVGSNSSTSAAGFITCYDAGAAVATNHVDTFLIFCLMALSVNCLYFLSRSLSAWVTVPRKYLLSQFGLVFTLIDTVSIVFPVAMLAIFLIFVYQIDKVENDDSLLPKGIYDNWMNDAEILSACSAAVAGLLYLKIIMYFKVLNQYTATFIFALAEVIKDIFWFFWIMVVIIFAFSQMFYTTLSCTEGYCRSDQTGNAPYNHFSSSLLYTYSILLGEFDLELFDTPFNTMLFVGYTFAIVIVVLNFLIAIVGDSFDKSMTKIETHFGRARLMFMVELSAFQSYASVPFDKGAKKKSYRRLLLCGNWKGCFLYLLVASALLTGFTFLTIDKEIVGRSGVGVLVTMGVLLGILLFSPFLWKLRCFAFLSESKLLQPIRSAIGRLLITFFRLILGKSILSERSDYEKKDWGGRLKHIISAMTEKITESEAVTSATISKSEAATTQAIEKVEQRVLALEENVSDIKSMLANIQALLENKKEQ